MPREMTDVERVINEQLGWATPATTDDTVMDEDTLQRSELKDDSLDCRWDELDKDGLPLSAGGL